MKTIKFWILTIFLISSSLTQAQNRLSEEDAFLYFLKIYDYKLADNSPAYAGINWYTVFLRKFRANELKYAMNDEFKKKEFNTRTNKELKGRTSSLSFEKTHTLSVKASLGNYDFNKKAFPLILNIDKFPSIVSNAENLYIKIFDIINFNDLELYLPVSQSSAESFLNNRKSSNGNIDRKVVANLSFNFTKIKVNREGANGFKRNQVVIYAHKIDVFADNSSQRPLGTIEPSKKWDDTVIPIKDYNGKQKIYYDRWWKLNKVNESKKSPYYTEIEYKNGKHTNPVKSYYNSSNKIFSTINWRTVGTDNWRFAKGNGIWYWDNGNIKEKGNYNERGYREGFFEEYWENGQLKSKVNYTNGKKNGCFEKYHKNGECDITYGSRTFHSYNNDEVKYSDPNCSCKNKPSTSNQNSNKKNTKKVTTANKTPTSPNKIFSSSIKNIPHLEHSIISAIIIPPTKSNSYLDKDFEQLKSELKKQPSLFERLNDKPITKRENFSTLKVEIISLGLLKGNSGGYTCNITYNFSLRDYFGSEAKLRDTYKSSGTISSGMLSLGVTKEKALNKVSQKLAEKLNKFLFETFPMELGIIKLTKNSKGNISSISVINSNNISSSKLDYYVYDKNEVKSFQNKLIIGKPIGKLAFDKKNGDKLILEVKKSKLQKALSEKDKNNLIILAK